MEKKLAEKSEDSPETNSHEESFDDITKVIKSESCPEMTDRKKPEKHKRGFRIDDILFSVTNNVHRLTKRDTPSPVTPTSERSADTTDADEMSPPSPVSFVNRHQSSRTASEVYSQEHDLHGDDELYEESYTRFHNKKATLSEQTDDIFDQQINDSKKPRTSFTPDQIQTLEDSFNEKHYLNHTERTMLAEELNLTDCQIKTWFQNRRMKMKRQYKEAVEKGHLIPYHPYPFPRYSRLTPAHFASVPALNSRSMMAKNNSFYHQSERVTSSCTCCGPTNRLYSESTYNKSIRTIRYSNDYPTERLHSPPEVLSRRREMERRDMRPLRDYLHQVRKDGS